MQSRPHVVVVGAGFAGLWAVHELRDAPCAVTLIDGNNYHTFSPLLYQVAAAELGIDQVVTPIRGNLRRLRNVRVLKGTAHGLDLQSRLIHVNDHAVEYDYLLLANGATSHYFDVPGAEENAFPLRTLEEAVALRNQVLRCFEETAYVEGRRREDLLTFVIVGGGPTGVEYAGALSELVRGPMAKDFPSVCRGDVRIVLLEAASTVLPGMAPKVTRYAMSRLQRMGVDARTDSIVSEVRAGEVVTKDGVAIPTRTVVWTAGVRGRPLAEQAGLAVNGRGQVLVARTLRVPEHPEVYVTGDLAAVPEHDPPVPMVAPAATQQGVHAARNIVRSIKGGAPEPFRYRDKGMLAVIGRNSAVAQLRWLSLTGSAAWLLWLGVHIYNLIGFRSRLMVMLNWAWDYILLERGVRIILAPGGRTRSRDDGPVQETQP